MKKRKQKQKWEKKTYNYCSPKANKKKEGKMDEKFKWKRNVQKQVKVLLISECFHMIEWSPLLAYFFQYLPYITCLTPLQPNMPHLFGIFGIYLSWVDWLIELWTCSLNCDLECNRLSV